MFLETFGARLPPPFAARLPQGQRWDPHPSHPSTAQGWAGTPRPGGPGLAPRSAALAPARAPPPAWPPRDAAGTTSALGSLCDPRARAWPNECRSGAGHEGKILNLALSRFLFYF